MARVPEVMVVDQDPKARYEVKQLAKQAQLTVAGEAAFGTEAVSLAADVKPEVIVCGISKPPERSLQTIEALLDLLPETPIVAYSWRDDAEVVRKAMMAGARDFFVMPAESERVLESIRAVLEAEERKRLRISGQAKALGPRGLIITVFGAKGGVGKSTVATNLGVALSGDLAHSVVLVDPAAALGALPLAALEESNMVLWITSSDFSSINNSLVALETLQQLSYPDARVRLMLNITSVDDGVRPAKIDEVLGRQFFWLVPYDRQLRLGGQIGKPVVSTHRDSRGAQSIIQLAQALMGAGPKGSVKPASSLRRFFTRREETNGHAPPAAPREKVIGSAETN